jgi:NADH-quinone oxidoreductase subunit M
MIGALTLLLTPRSKRQTLFATALFFTSLTFVGSLIVMGEFDGGKGEMQLIERVAWIPAYGIEYHVGIDGISLFLVLLTTLLMPLAILASWSVAEKVRSISSSCCCWKPACWVLS